MRRNYQQRLIIHVSRSHAGVPKCGGHFLAVRGSGADSLYSRATCMKCVPRTGTPAASGACFVTPCTPSSLRTS